MPIAEPYEGSALHSHHMAGAPIRKARREAAATAAITPDAVLKYPRTRPQPRSFRNLPAHAKFEHVFICSIDDAEAVLSRDPFTLDPHALATWRTVWQGVMSLGGKIILSRMRTDVGADAALRLVLERINSVAPTALAEPEAHGEAEIISPKSQV